VTLILGKTAIAFGNEMWAYNSVSFSAFGSGADATALDFTSPNDHFLCDISVSLDTGSMVENDILAIILRASGENIYLAKWALGDPVNFGEPIGPPPIRVILPPNTVFKTIFSLTSSSMVGTANVALVGRKLGGT